MSDTKKTTAGEQILDFLKAKGRKARKAGTATTEEIAGAIGQTVKYTYDRLYWMAARDGILVKSGSGKAAVWRTTPKARKPKAAEAVEAPPADAAAEEE